MQVSNDLKSLNQCMEVRNKAYRVLGYINRVVYYKSREVVLKLYSAFVRPHLEFSGVASSPHFRKDVELLERVQHRATRMVAGLSELEYEDRLRELGLYTLERRRLRGLGRAV